MKASVDVSQYQLCPKCQGQGTVSKPPWIAGDVNEWASTSAIHQCDVCNGNKILPNIFESLKSEAIGFGEWLRKDYRAQRSGTTDQLYLEWKKGEKAVDLG